MGAVLRWIRTIAVISVQARSRV
jgi:carbon-monoxide dehydrogenase large subunit